MQFLIDKHSLLLSKHFKIKNVAYPLFHLISFTPSHSFFNKYITENPISTEFCTIFYVLGHILITLMLLVVMKVQLSQAISCRLQEYMQKKGMTNYQLSMRSGVPKATVRNIINCTYESVQTRIIHEICQVLGISISEFFHSPLFDESNLEP